MSFDRKFKKLLRDPKLFFKDFYFKRTTQLKKHLPIKHTGKNNFTIVTAVYNVEKYLDEFFESIKNQSLDFKKHIFIICVDDGSTDNSANIIKRWQKKYPKNIQYIYKENGGQASARNLGLKEVKTDWVTFTDPDDFLHPDYFYEIDNSLNNNDDVCSVVTNLHFYIEKNKITRDSHPLKYRFQNSQSIFNCKDLKNNINLSAASTIFKTDIIKDSTLLFDPNLKPNFEDARFIADFNLNANQTQTVIFLKRAIYYYRKREDSSSTIDRSWVDPRKFYNVLVYGHLDILQKYKLLLGKVPLHVQRTTIYDISWYIKYLINSPEKTDFLTTEQKEVFHETLIEIFKYIEAKTILEFNLSGVWFFHKVGMLGMFKEQQPTNQIVYIENVDREKKEILLTYFSYFDKIEEFILNDQDALPRIQKTVNNDFVGKNFAHEKRIWLPYQKVDQLLMINLDNKNARISLKGKQYSKGIKIKTILESFKPSSKYLTDGSWILMDRDIQADDNAEHLYRYISKNHPEQKCYFALNKNSHDWSRLKEDGFNLLEFGSDEFENKLRKSSKIISSHLDRYINNYFGDEYEYSKKFVFLQHGITQNDISSWFNLKKNLQCVVTATKPEYHSIADDFNHYKLTKKEIVLTGFPRHDQLIKNNNSEKIILIMPTWRRSIVGEVVGDGNQRQLNKNFMDTFYARSWHSFLHSDKLKDLSLEYGYKIVFAPHANISPYVSMLNVPKYIEIWQASTSSESMQQLFQKAKLMITDYSSVAFEMAFLEKFVIYYQFDKEETFSGGHIIQRGYFTYDKDGFGPVVTEEEEVINQLKKVLNNNGEPFEPFATRIKNTFPYRDGKNCERVYQAILALDEPEEVKPALDTQYKYCQQAVQSSQWALLEKRTSHLLTAIDDKGLAENIALHNKTQHLHARSLFNQCKFSELLDFVAHDNRASEYWQARIAMWSEDFATALYYYQKSDVSNVHDILRYLWCCAVANNSAKFEELKAQLLTYDLNDAQQFIIEVATHILNQSYDQALTLIDESFADYTVLEKRQYQLELIAAKLCIKASDYDKAHKFLVQFEQHTVDLPKCRMTIAHLAFLQQNYSKCIAQISKLPVDVHFHLPMYLKVEYLQSLLVLNNMDGLDLSLSTFSDKEIIANDDLLIIKIKLLSHQESWQEIINLLANTSQKIKTKLVFENVLACIRLGMIEKALQIYEKPNYTHSYEYFELIKLLALISNDKPLYEHCLKQMLCTYPNIKGKENTEELKQLLF